MRLINKKYLILLTSILLVITSVLVIKQTKPVELDEVKLTESSNNNSFAMYRETNNGYEEYDADKFPEGYVLNINESKCLDNKGNEQKGILSYENGLVTVTSGNTSYCYLYFDKTLGVEIKDKNSNGLKTDKTRGGMYRYQGQQTDNIENYICFGTSDNCGTNEEDISKYMYRIIGIEAKSGRVKVIKKEALDQTYPWWDDYDHDVDFPKSRIYEAIIGTSFLENSTYIPKGWKEKISDNTWMYGDMMSNDSMGAKQAGEGLYLAETGQKETNWVTKANQDDEDVYTGMVKNENSQYNGEIYYYKKHYNEKWTDTFESKVSLIYLHDYYYSISDTANCEHYEDNYAECKTGWIHISQNYNDNEISNLSEWTMTRHGWSLGDGFFEGHAINSIGSTSNWGLREFASVRPVFYIDASQTLKDGTGKIDDPFIIN